MTGLWGSTGGLVSKQSWSVRSLLPLGAVELILLLFLLLLLLLMILLVNFGLKAKAIGLNMGRAGGFTWMVMPSGWAMHLDFGQVIFPCPSFWFFFFFPLPGIFDMAPSTI